VPAHANACGSACPTTAVRAVPLITAAGLACVIRKGSGRGQAWGLVRASAGSWRAAFAQPAPRTSTLLCLQRSMNPAISNSLPINHAHPAIVLYMHAMTKVGWLMACAGWQACELFSGYNTHSSFPPPNHTASSPPRTKGQGLTWCWLTWHALPLTWSPWPQRSLGLGLMCPL
jgi:hypothetical protein